MSPVRVSRSGSLPRGGTGRGPKGTNMSPSRPWRRALLWLALLAPFFYLSYGLANHLAGQRSPLPSVVFEWERGMPFWAWTIFPYWSINLFYAASLFIARHRHTLDRHALRLATAQCIAVACFVATPLQFSFGQPAVDGAAGWLFAALRSFDQPYNQAPSLHIALAVILWDLYRRHISGTVARTVLQVWTLAICGSVLTTWQHHFIDIPTGALLGVLCVWAWPLERRVSMGQAWRLAGDRQRRTLAARYGIAAALLLAAALALGGAGLWLAWPAVSLALVALAYVGFGERAFQMSRDGRMGWAARWLLLPYRAAAAVNGRWWTRGLPPARELVPGVWIGSLARLPQAAQGERRAVVSLCAELQAPAGGTCLCLPWLDLVPASPAALRRAAAAIDAAVTRGDAVVVGCALGFSRSAAALACWLARSGRANGVDAALAALARVHPQVVLGADWRRALQQAAR